MTHLPLWWGGDGVDMLPIGNGRGEGRVLL